MSALAQQFIAAQGTGEEYNVQKRGTMEQPFNASKGCGSVMRAAPIGLMLNEETQNLRRENVAMLRLRTGIPSPGCPRRFLPR